MPNDYGHLKDIIEDLEIENKELQDKIEELTEDITILNGVIESMKEEK